MPDLSPVIEQTITTALAEARRQRFPILGTPHLFIALTKLDRAAAQRECATGCGSRWARTMRRLAPSPN
jgi:hypothetical protein